MKHTELNSLTSAETTATSAPNRQRRRLLQGVFGVAAGAGLLGLGGCGGSDEEDAGYLRLVNATEDLTTAKLSIDGDSAVTGLAYGGTTTNYMNAGAGNHSFTLKSSSGSTSLSASYDLETDSYSSLIAYGAATSSTGLKLMRLDDNNTAPSSSYVKVRLLHLMDGQDGLDLYTTNSSSLSDAEVTCTVSAYEDLSDFVTIAKGTHRIRITYTGTTTVLFDSGSDVDVSLAGGSIITLAVVPRAADSYPDVVALPEQSNNAAVLTNTKSV